MRNYNSTYHAGVLERPIDIYEGRKPGYSQINVAVFNIPLGSHVRVKKNRDLFEKGTKPQWSDEIATVQSTEGNRYVLSDGKKIMERDLLIVVPVTEQVRARNATPRLRPSRSSSRAQPSNARNQT